ncbi:MAG: Mur ligase domain-containing protein [Candidatus Nomurabacteria bacterium]|jgi:UDP-N-acetylmuramate--alanine ligase|nr:Mur ligase domain-containing protein [Candidatus Nomurabacteria bacterium]
MHIFFSGIGGSGISSLALIAQDSGFEVSGSDQTESPASLYLEKRDIDVVYQQTAQSIAAEHLTRPIDWLVYSAAVPNDAPELKFARAHKIRLSKRDEFLTKFIKEKNLRLIAVAGTHGKTTTTSAIVWLLQNLNRPVSYAVGATLPFAPSGAFNPESKIFVLECDEYDRNFLKFNPDIAVLPAVDFDHSDIYPTREDYRAAFRRFISQSQNALLYQKTFDYLQPLPEENLTVFEHRSDFDEIAQAGQATRDDLWLAAQAVRQLGDYDEDELFQILAKFPGADRRFEKLSKNIYLDYAHTPAEIAATIEKAREINPQVAAVYQPHQNARQREIQAAGGYQDAFDGAAEVFIVPTFLTRQDLKKDAPPVLTPDDLIAGLTDPEIAEAADLDDNLLTKIRDFQKDGALVLLMGAGTIDGWARENLAQN